MIKHHKKKFPFKYTRIEQDEDKTGMEMRYRIVTLWFQFNFFKESIQKA